MPILIASADPGLQARLHELCAAGGAVADVATELQQPGRESAGSPVSWLAASLVLLGDDLARDAASAVSTRRRPGVVLVSEAFDDAEAWQRAVAVGAEHVAFLPDAADWLVGRVREATRSSVLLAPLVAVLGARGGAGATTLASGLAVTAARRGRRPVLVDADPMSAGIDLLLGLEAPGLRWGDAGLRSGLARGAGPEDSRAVVDQLPVIDGLSVLTTQRETPVGPLDRGLPDLVAALRTASDLVLADLPRSVEEPVTTVLAAATLVLLVVPAEVRATAAAYRMRDLLTEVAGDVRLVVRGPSPGGLDEIAVAAAVGLPLAGWLRPDPGLAVGLEVGEPPASSGRGPLARLCRRLLDDPVIAGSAARDRPARLASGALR